MSDWHFPVESGHIMLFARSIGDPNPIYSDADYASTTEVGHIIAPPTFLKAAAQFDPDYPLRPRPGQPWMGSGREPTGLPPSQNSGAGGLAAESRFDYHRHPKPGDVLTATALPGESWTKEGRRAGKLTFRSSITEWRDQNGELVVTVTTVGVQTERPAKD